MAHKSLIGGTVYEKYGGADLINGTVYKKYYGKVLSSGAHYEVGFDSNVPAVFQVSKITADTYSGTTSYTGEKFVLLSVSPKTNGTVKITYEGLTKTITDTSGAETPNAQNVYFGTFYGVTDDVATPDSGTLTIEGDYASYSFNASYEIGKDKDAVIAFGCLTKVLDTGNLITIDSGTFSRCMNLTSVNCNDNVLAVKDNAFSYCTALSTVYVNSGVSELSARAFSGCSALYNVTIDSKNPYYTQEGNVWFNKNKSVLCGSINTFSGHYSIPSSVRSIVPYAFYSATTLPSVTIPNGITEIGANVFSGCSNLSSVGFPNTLVSIGDYAFYNSGLVDVNNLPSSLKTIGSYAFSYCTKMTNIYIPDSVTSMGNRTFYGCSNLNSVRLSNNMEEVPAYCCYNLNLSSVYIGSNTKIIREDAFYSCGNLLSVNIPHGVTTIGDSAFNECNKWTDVTIPATVTTIDGFALFCDNTVSRIYRMLPTTPPSLPSTTAIGVKGGGSHTIIVPKGCASAYKNAPYWSVYSDKIVEAS